MTFPHPHVKSHLHRNSYPHTWRELQVSRNYHTSHFTPWHKPVSSCHHSFDFSHVYFKFLLSVLKLFSRLSHHWIRFTSSGWLRKYLLFSQPVKLTLLSCIYWRVIFYTIHNNFGQPKKPPAALFQPTVHLKQPLTFPATLTHVLLYW